ncbi:FAD-dependent urate hydroxylase HpxO [Psychromonas sp. KJ10-2]|uniref:FAD-dependent urate hydroxylase HpxO n=1 Tax=Psychromonas sp. KJ10-2 TaxID=3391822 RepID=UPI0039B3EAD5
MKALIIGAGIGGVSAAVSLKKQGIECEIFEAVKEIKPVGAAISVWSNGVKCMNHLGMGHIMDKLGGPMLNMAYQDGKTAEVLTQFSLAPLIEAVGERPCPVSRADLQSMMIDYWGKEKIQFDKRIERIAQDEKGVSAYFTDGSLAHGDFMIAADGANSVARSFVLGRKVERRYAGYVNWNGLIDTDPSIAPIDQWTTFVGDGKRISLMPISDNRFYFFFDVPLPSGLPQDRSTVTEDLTRYFTDWAEPIQKLIKAIDPSTTNRVEIHDADPFTTYVDRRIALLGDSAHPTTPDIGQGGCSAMEDAVVLGQAFSATKDIHAALSDYESQRNQRAKGLVLKARKRCEVTHGEDMQITQDWYKELKQETGDNIMAGLKETIIGGPLG